LNAVSWPPAAGPPHTLKKHTKKEKKRRKILYETGTRARKYFIRRNRVTLFRHRKERARIVQANTLQEKDLKHGLLPFCFLVRELAKNDDDDDDDDDILSDEEDPASPRSSSSSFFLFAVRVRYSHQRGSRW
jgi:hypothetical protein